MLYPQIKQHCQSYIQHFDAISEERKITLSKLSEAIQKKKDANESIDLVFVCTHNSRRSVLGEIWGAIAAHYFGMSNVKTYSGGTVATAVHTNTIKCLVANGLQIHSSGNTDNPKYVIGYGESLSNTTFSKTFDADSNPQSSFIAVMTCEDAAENCPFVPGATARISLTYDDPKQFDGTFEEWKGYLQRSEQIARELLYVFSQIH
jgi:protein-tyrosine phosphatase/arsenate reductase